MVPSQGLQIAPVSVHLLPAEGPKAIPVYLDFTGAATSYTVDLSELQSQGYVSMIQSIFIDMQNALPGSGLLVSVSNGVQTLQAVYATQGYYQILAQNPVKITFTQLGTPPASAGIGAIISIALLNIAIPGVVWPVFAA